MLFTACFEVSADDEMVVASEKLRAYLNKEGYSYEMTGRGVEEGGQLKIEVTFSSKEAGEKAAEDWRSIRYLKLDDFR